MIESKCGLLCSGCSYRASCGCGGCAETNGNPFHGKCTLAACCRGKGFEHCGMCPDMPCKLLYAYSFLDREHGDNPPGARLKVLGKWALEDSGGNNPLYLKAAAIMKAAENATIAVIDQEGFPKASTITNVRTDGIKLAWFATTLESGKAACLSKNNKCSVCYTDGRSNISLQGTVEIMTDPEIKKLCWLDWFKDYYTGGVEDPEYCVVRFAAKRAVIRILAEKAELEFSDIL